MRIARGIVACITFFYFVAIWFQASIGLSLQHKIDSDFPTNYWVDIKGTMTVTNTTVSVEDYLSMVRHRNGEMVGISRLIKFGLFLSFLSVVFAFVPSRKERAPNNPV